MKNQIISFPFQSLFDLSFQLFNFRSQLLDVFTVMLTLATKFLKFGTPMQSSATRKPELKFATHPLALSAFI